jgi:predicted Rossmann fold flavoprotein
MKKKMIIVGGGAAGMMCAVKAADSYDVTIIEKNEKLGKKLFITGKGRCNLTNDSDEEEFLGNVVNNYKFLYSSIYSYNQNNVMEDFISWGLKLKTERGNRVFPVSDHSSDVIKALETQLNKKGVKVLLNTAVKELLYTIDESESADRRITGVLTNKGTMDADVVVLATGGLSYPQTGSTGDGFNILTDALKDDETLMQKALSPMIPAL